MKEIQEDIESALKKEDKALTVDDAVKLVDKILIDNNLTLGDFESWLKDNKVGSPNELMDEQKKQKLHKALEQLDAA